MTPGRETKTCTLWAWPNIRILGFPHSSDGKECACSVGDLGSLPGSGKSPREGNGNALQYPCLGNATDRGASRVIVHGVTKSQIRLSN